jgi:hypothetical protein
MSQQATSLYMLTRCWYGIPDECRETEAIRGNALDEILLNLKHSKLSPPLLSTELKILLASRSLLMRDSEKGKQLAQPGGLIFFWGNDISESPELFYFLLAKCHNVVALCKGHQILSLLDTLHSATLPFDARCHQSTFLGQSIRGNPVAKTTCWYAYLSNNSLPTHGRCKELIDFLQVSKHDGVGESLVSVRFYIEEKEQLLSYHIHCPSTQLEYAVSQTSLSALTNEYSIEVHHLQKCDSSFDESSIARNQKCDLRLHKDDEGPETCYCCPIDAGYDKTLSRHWNLPRFGKDNSACNNLSSLSKLAHMCANFALFSKSFECTTEHFHNMMSLPDGQRRTNVFAPDVDGGLMISNKDEARNIGHMQVNDRRTERQWQRMVHNYTSDIQKKKGIVASGCLFRRLLVDLNLSCRERISCKQKEMDILFKYATTSSVLHDNPAFVWDILFLLQRHYQTVFSQTISSKNPFWFFTTVVRWLCLSNSVFEYNTISDIDILIHNNYKEAILKIPCARYTFTEMSMDQGAFDYIYLQTKIDDRG